MNVGELSRIAAIIMGALLLSSMLSELDFVAGTGPWRITAYVLSILVVAGPCLLFSAVMGSWLRGGGAGTESIVLHRDMPVEVACALLGLWCFASAFEGLIGSFGVVDSHLTDEHKALLFSGWSVAIFSLILVLQSKAGWGRGMGRVTVKDSGSANGEVVTVALRVISLFVLAGVLGGIARMVVDWFAIRSSAGAADVIFIALQLAFFLGLWQLPVSVLFRHGGVVNSEECEGAGSAGAHHIAKVSFALLGLWMVIDGLADFSYWAFLLYYCHGSVGVGCGGSTSPEEQVFSVVSALIQSSLAILVFTFRSFLSKLLSPLGSR